MDTEDPQSAQVEQRVCITGVIDFSRLIAWDFQSPVEAADVGENEMLVKMHPLDLFKNVKIPSSASVR